MLGTAASRLWQTARDGALSSRQYPAGESHWIQYDALTRARHSSQPKEWCNSACPPMPLALPSPAVLHRRALLVNSTGRRAVSIRASTGAASGAERHGPTADNAYLLTCDHADWLKSWLQTDG